MFSKEEQQITDPEDRSKDTEHRQKVISGFFINRMFFLHQVHGAHTVLFTHRVPEENSTRQQFKTTGAFIDRPFSSIFYFCSNHMEYNKPKGQDHIQSRSFFYKEGDRD